MKSNSIFRTAMVLFLAMFTTTVWADVNFENVLEKDETISMLDGDPAWVYQQKVWFRIKNAPEGAMMMKLMVIKQDLSFFIL